MGNILYISIDLDRESRLKLKSLAESCVNDNFGTDAVYKCHHCTIAFINRLDDATLEWCIDNRGETFTMTVDRIGVSDLACAVAVDFDQYVPCKQNYPHITVAVNPVAGGKPVDSNYITEFQDVYENIELSGVLTFHYRGEYDNTTLNESLIRKNLNSLIFESAVDEDPIEAYLNDYEPKGIPTLDSVELADWCQNVGAFLYIYNFGGWRIMNANLDDIVNDIVSDIHNCGYIERTHEADDYILSRPKEFDRFYVAVYKICDIPGEKDYYVVYQEENYD